MYMQKEKRGVLGEVSYWTKVIILGVVLGTGLQFALAVWTPRPAPPVTPPEANLPGPLTTGAGQIKEGNLIVNTGLIGLSPAANGLIVANGNVGIGTIDPGAKLEVNGKTRAQGYCNQDGSKCLSFDTQIGDPLYYQYISWGAPWDNDPYETYQQYNTAMIKTIETLFSDTGTRNIWKNICLISSTGKFPSDYHHNVGRFEWCGHFACSARMPGNWPEMVTLSDACEQNGGSNCNNNKFMIGWDCLNKIEPASQNGERSESDIKKIIEGKAKADSF